MDSAKAGTRCPLQNCWAAREYPMLAWRGLRQWSWIYSLSSWSEPCLCQHEPRDTHPTCSSGAAMAWSSFRNSASRQAVWNRCSRTRARILGEGQAPVHLSEAAVNFLPHPKQLLFRQEKAEEQSFLKSKKSGLFCKKRRQGGLCWGWESGNSKLKFH